MAAEEDSTEITDLQLNEETLEAIIKGVSDRMAEQAAATNSSGTFNQLAQLDRLS